MSNNEERIIDGRYLEKSELEKRLKIMGVNFVEHILKTKWDYASVYNNYIHKPEYFKKVKSLLKHDVYSDLVSRKSTSKKKVVKIDLSDDESSYTEKVSMSNLGRKRKGTASKDKYNNTETQKKSVLKNKATSEIDLVGESSNRSKSRSKNKSINKSSTYSTTSKKKEDKKIYNVLFPNNSNLSLIENNTRSKSKSKDSIYSKKYDSMVNQLIKITKKAQADNKSSNSNKKKQNIKYNINSINTVEDLKKSEVPIIKEQKLRTNQKTSTVISQSSNINHPIPTSHINSHHINVICNVNNPKAANEFTLGKPKIKRNVFMSSGKNPDATVKNLNKSPVVETDEVIKSNISPNNNKYNNNNNQDYLEENTKLYNQLGLQNINIRQETPFRYASENKAVIINKPNYSASNNKFNSFVPLKSNTKQNKGFVEYIETSSSRDSSAISIEVTKINKIMNFMSRDICCIQGVNPWFLLKSGLSIAVIGYFCYILSNPDKYSSIFNQITEFLNSTGYADNLNWQNTIVGVLILCLTYLFVISVKRHQNLKIATNDYNNLLEISSEDEFPEESSFGISEAMIIKRMSERSNISPETYACDVYPHLKELIAEDDYFYFTEIDDTVFLKLIPGAREKHAVDPEKEVSEFDNGVEIQES